MPITTINPATGETLATYDSHDDAAIEQLLEAAHEATLAWGGRVAPAERGRWSARWRATLRDRVEELAGLITDGDGQASGGSPPARSRSRRSPPSSTPTRPTRSSATAASRSTGWTRGSPTSPWASSTP